MTQYLGQVAVTSLALLSRKDRFQWSLIGRQYFGQVAVCTIGPVAEKIIFLWLMVVVTVTGRTSCLHQRRDSAALIITDHQSSDRI